VSSGPAAARLGEITQVEQKIYSLLVERNYVLDQARSWSRGRHDGSHCLRRDAL